MPNPVSIEIFQRDDTIRWSTRKGDLVVWFDYHGMMSAPENMFGIKDFWELDEGQFVTITNRPSDFPPGFELHPSEVSNVLAHEMLAKINAGHVPGDVVDGPNLWRVLCGDRLAWVGEPRPGRENDEGVLAILGMEENALVYGSSTLHMSLMDMMGFGAPAENAKTESSIRGSGRHENVLGGGMPRSSAFEWRIGYYGPNSRGGCIDHCPAEY
jgi:hypothetical protein